MERQVLIPSDFGFRDPVTIDDLINTPPIEVLQVKFLITRHLKAYTNALVAALEKVETDPEVQYNCELHSALASRIHAPLWALYTEVYEIKTLSEMKKWLKTDNGRLFTRLRFERNDSPSDPVTT